MPQVLRIDRYCVFFWSNEGVPAEAVHVHVSEGKPVRNATKIWFKADGTCVVANNNSGIPEHALHNILRVLEAYHQEAEEKWTEHFGECEFFGD